MERPAKRPRLINPLDSVHTGRYNNQHAYYDASEDELNEYEGSEENADEGIYDPDQELQRKRAHADFKLKSTFEAIFEKYGKDFGAIGDEIDMRTGEILVNNGHIFSMRHEMDAGDSQTTLSEDRDADMSGSEEDDLEDDLEDEEVDEDQSVEDELGEKDEEDYDEEDPLSDEEMVEDDMILRGFVQASQQLFHRQPPHKPGLSRDRFARRTEPQHATVLRPSLLKSTLPSRSEILAQFGPQLGPEIVNYVSKRGVPKDSNIEPAWRVPNIESALRVPDIEPAWRGPDLPPTAVRRPLIRSMVIQPGLEAARSPSPENAPSIWAMTAQNPPGKRASRKPFSPYEDQSLFEFVADARRRGMDLSKISTWKQLEAMNSRRCAKAWKRRYATKFTYLRSSSVVESDLSTSDLSSGPAQRLAQRLDFGMSLVRPAPPHPSRPVDAQRPTRVRKPAQRDGIVSWSEAIATIASVDPIGNAALLDDVRRTGYPLPYELPVPSTFPNRRHSLDGSTPRRPFENKRGYPQRPGLYADSSRGIEHELNLNSPAFPVNGPPENEARCPHTNCKSYSTTLYRLERRYDEELSPMCSHLLYVHHTTPFPCRESNCEYKGARGYFMQEDLVRHIRDTHPYSSDLLGCVEPVLPIQSNHSDQPRQSIEGSYNMSLGKQASHSDLLAPYGVSPLPRPCLDFDKDLDETVTLRAGARAVSEGALSMHVHPSSVGSKDMPAINNREASFDSELQLVDESPFENIESSKTEDERYFIRDTGIPNGDNHNNHAPASDRSFTHAMASGEPQSGKVPRIPPKFTTKKMISSRSRNMNIHRENHEKMPAPSTTPKESQLISTPRVPATIPNSQNSPINVHLQALFLRPENGQASRRVKSNDPSGHVERVVDRSYEFSDEEDGIRPTTRTPRTQTSLHQQPLSVSQKPLSVPRKSLPVPLSSFCPAPLTKIESPQIQVPAKLSAILANNDSSRADHSIFTPPTKRKSRDSAIHNVLMSDEIDELSLGEDGFVLLSARPRTDKLPRLPFQVKREDAEEQAPLAKSTKKRLFSSIEVEDEADELAAEEGPSVSTPHHRRPTSGSNTLLKATVRESDPASMPRMTRPKPRKRPSLSFKSHHGSSLRPHTSHQQLPTQTSTPLLDLVSRGSTKNNVTNGSAAEIPSTSELGSSPNSRRHTLAALVTPQKKTWATRAVKLEDENGLDDSVVTPGGTLRRCGLDGFVCGRAFCFRCQTDDAITR